MGKSYSKREEIVIAQNGANSANQSSLEQRIEFYGLAIGSLVVILLIIVACLMVKRCHRGTKRWIRKELSSAVSVNSVDKVAQQPATINYA